MFNGLIVAALAFLPGEVDAPKPATLARTLAFRADVVYRGDGTSIDDGVILVKEGVITQVGSGLEIPEGAAIVDHDGAISAGLIALHSEDGAGAELYDSTRIVLAEAEARHAFAPEHADFDRALAAGITALVLAPSSSSLIGGQSAVVKTSGGRVVKPAAQLALSLSRDALHTNRFPTSYAGAIEELERRFGEPEGPVARAASGSLPVLIDVNDRAETLRAIGFAQRFGLKGALYGSYWAEEIAPQIAGSGLDVICTPFDVGDDSRSARAVVALAKEGVRLGFGLDAPERHPGSLRFGAAACVRAGLETAKARKALTGDAAAIAGVAGRIGRVARGLDADLVLWSGDPVALTSSIQAVYVDGELVHGGSK